FAAAAFALQVHAVAEGGEEIAGAIDVGERFAFYVPGFEWEEAAGVDVADVGDEDEAFAFVDAARGAGDGAALGLDAEGHRAGAVLQEESRGVDQAGFLIAEIVQILAALDCYSLQRVAPIVHRLGRPNRERHAFGRV